MHRLGNALGWVLGSVLVLMGLVFETDRLVDPAGISFLVGALLIIPATRRKLADVFPLKPLWAAGGAVVLFLVGCLLAAKTDEEGKALGFADGRAYRKALALGLKTPKEFADYNEGIARQNAEADRRRQEAEAERAQAAAVEQERKDAERRRAEVETAEKEANCRVDLNCWGEKNMIKAAFRCAPQVERLAKYQHEWTDGWLGPKFTRVVWKDKANGVLTYVGDQIKFQNGFGAWQYHIYACDFDTRTETVLSVEAEPGRLSE